MPTSRSIPQVIFNHLPGSLIFIEEQGLFGQVTNVDGHVDSSIDVNRLANRINVAIDKWREGDEDGRGQINPDIGYLQPTDIEVINPVSVEWEIFPYYYRCRKQGCGVWQYRGDLIQNQGHCHRCGSPLEQTPFVWVHHCGYLTTLASGKKAHCNVHKERSLYLYDTRTFATSSWRCHECGHQRQVGFLQCPQCNSTKPRPQPMRWNDPGVYSGVNLQMINLSQEDRYRLLGGQRLNEAINAVLSCAFIPGNSLALEMSDVSSDICSNCGKPVPVSAKYCDQCGTSIHQSETNTTNGSSTVIVPEEVMDDLVTYTLLWDLPGTSSLRCNGDWDNENRFGVDDLIYLERFPISLVGLGFRRQRSKRPATLCLYHPATGASTKSLRVFTYSTDVEACAIRLSPKAVFEWLNVNNVTENEDTVLSSSPSEILTELNILSQQYPVVRKMIIGLLHTVSHAYIIGQTWCSGMDLPSFSEALLPGALTTIIHAGDNSLGGLSAVFTQTPWQPLEMAAEDLTACQLDPSCSDDDGGACVACLHLPRGCELWNSALSRAYLFGGEIGEGQIIEKGFWDK